MNAPKKMHSDDRNTHIASLVLVVPVLRVGVPVHGRVIVGRRARPAGASSVWAIDQSSAVPGSMRPGEDAEQEHDHARDREPRVLEHRGVAEDRQTERQDEREERRRRQVDAVAVAVAVVGRRDVATGAVVATPPAGQAARGGPPRPRCTCGARSRRRAWTSGISAKLYSGTGDGIDHSSVRPSHGSALATSPRAAVLMMFTRNTSTDERDDERADRDAAGCRGPSPCPSA